MGAKRDQQGVVLLVGLIMLILLTLMAVAALNLGKSNFAVVSNQQSRTEANRAADQVVEQIVANTNITLQNGTNLFGTGSNNVTVDINGDGNSDYTVTVAEPVCVKKKVIDQATLNPSVPDDLGCMKNVDQLTLGVEGAAGSGSLCSEVVWDVSVSAVDAFKQANVTLRQGLSQRVATNAVATVCD